MCMAGGTVVFVSFITYICLLLCVLYTIGEWCVPLGLGVGSNMYKPTRGLLLLTGSRVQALSTSLGLGDQCDPNTYRLGS
jgi:hypothetical protein